jgi:hypothetical protein
MIWFPRIAQNAPCLALDHILLPLEHLRQEVDFFAREESLRVLHVLVDPALQGPALDILRAMQWSPDNRRAVFVLEDPAQRQAERWNVWNEQVRAAFADIRAAYVKAGVELANLGPLDEVQEPLIRFAAVLKAASDILGQAPARTNGITVVFSTAALRDPDRWLAFLVEILNRTPSLASVRWGWMETGRAIGNEFVPGLGKDVALHVECRVDPVRQEKDLQDLLAAMAGAGDQVSGPIAAGAAGPTVEPPPHPTDPPKPSEPSPASRTNRLFLKGVQAVRSGDMKEAVRLQSLAFEQCLSSPNVPLTVEMELMLATYVVQAAGGETSRLHSALAIFQRASERAYQAGLAAVGAKIDIVLAPMAKLVGEFELAGRALRRAADRARTLAPALSIEALHLAADFMLESGNPTKATELLREALAIAASLPIAEVQSTAASMCAESLAAILRDQKQDREASEMDDLAARFAPR